MGEWGGGIEIEREWREKEMGRELRLKRRGECWKNERGMEAEEK